MIQIDMEMPATCYDCPFCYDCMSCTLSDGSEFDFEICDEQRMLYCPLKEVPETNVGKWTTKRTQEHDGEWYCSVCEYEPIVFIVSNYCPNCGAIMDGDT